MVTVVIAQDICEGARAPRDWAGYGRVKVVWADGGFRYEADAPYDRVEVTVGCYDLSPYWVEQLKPGGLLTVPLCVRGQQFIPTFVREGMRLVFRSVVGGGFMRLRDAFAGPESYLHLPGG